MTRIQIFLRQRLAPLLHQGLSPRDLTMTLCLGTAIGIMPLIWGTTLICAVAAVRFRLNQAAIQAANYLVYPLQIALFLPFLKLGDKMLPWGPQLPRDVFHLFRSGGAYSSLTWVMGKALAGWVVTALPATVAIIVVVNFLPNLKTTPEM